MPVGKKWIGQQTHLMQSLIVTSQRDPRWYRLVFSFLRKLLSYRLSILTYRYDIEIINFMVNHPFDITDIPTTWRYVLPFCKLVAYP